MTLAEQFAANLVSARNRTGISQEEFGFRADLHRTQIGKLERAERLPRLPTLIKLAYTVEVEPAELLVGISWVPAERAPGHFEVGGLR